MAPSPSWTLAPKLAKANAAHIELPLRVLPMPLRRLARAALLLGVVLLFVAAEPLLGGELRAPVWVHSACACLALVPLAFAALLLYGRSWVDYSGEELMIGERAGPITYRRRFASAAITHLQVEELTFNLGGKDERGRQNTESITILAASTKDYGRRVLLFGYPPALLQHVVAELRRRTPWQAPIVAGLGRNP